jgi:hypothetical protein
MFTALQPSGFTLNVSADSYLSQSLAVTLTSSRTLNVALRPQPLPITLTGRITDAGTAGPIAGAIVSINGRYQATTDTSGTYSVTGLLDAGNHADITYVSATNYESDYRYIQGNVQNVHLYRIERMTAGESKLVTIAPDDTLCVNNLQDEPTGLGPDYVCRTVRVMVPGDGLMTAESVSAQNGAHLLLEVEVNHVPADWSMRNPTPPFPVTTGAEVVMNVEMPSGSTTSQSFVVNTSIAQP